MGFLEIDGDKLAQCKKPINALGQVPDEALRVAINWLLQIERRMAQ